MINRELDSEYISKKSYEPETQDFNLVDITYQQPNTDSFGTYVVSRREEARMDLVSKRLYNDTNSDHFLMKINQIYNPYRIKAGDVLLYTSKTVIEDTVRPDEQVENIKQAIIDANKPTRYDNRRLEFIQENRSRDNNRANALPPVIDASTREQTEISGSSVFITPGLVRETLKPPRPVIQTPPISSVIDKKKQQNGEQGSEQIIFIPSLMKPKNAANTFKQATQDALKASSSRTTRTVEIPKPKEQNVNLDIQDNLDQMNQ